MFKNLARAAACTARLGLAPIAGDFARRAFGRIAGRIAP